MRVKVRGKVRVAVEGWDAEGGVRVRWGWNEGGMGVRWGGMRVGWG